MCSDDQIRQAAIAFPGYGVRVFYSLESGHIFKFRTYLEAGCLNGVDSEGRESVGRIEAACNPNAHKEIEQMPIDSDLIGPFSALVNIHQNDPAFLRKSTIEVTADINVVGWDPSNPPQHFDPYMVAYDDIGSTLNNFMDAAEQFANDQSHLSVVSGSLASYIYDFLAPFSSAEISVSNSGVGISLPLDALLTTEFTIRFVDSTTGAYIKVRFVRVGNTTNFRAEFVNAADVNNVPLIALSDLLDQDGAIRQYHGPRGWEAANHMANFLRRNHWGGDFYIPNGCRTTILSCIREPAEHRMCSVDCYP